MEDKKLNAGRVGLTMKGAWNASQSYEKLNCVSHNGRSWAAKKNVSAGVEPSAANSEFWQMMSDRGEQGIQGPAGPQGNSAFDGTGVEIVNNLTQGGEAAVLSAEQGKILKTELTELESNIGSVIPINIFDARGFTTSNTSNFTLEKDRTYLKVVHHNSYTTGTPICKINLPEGDYVLHADFSESIGRRVFDFNKNGVWEKNLGNGNTFSILSGNEYTLTFQAPEGVFIIKDIAIISSDSVNVKELKDVVDVIAEEYATKGQLQEANTEIENNRSRIAVLESNINNTEILSDRVNSVQESVKLAQRSIDEGRTVVNGLNENVTNITEAISSMALGIFYGFYNTSDSLPIKDGNGYAYVGDNGNYVIWNFDGQSWTSSNVEITRNIDDNVVRMAELSSEFDFADCLSAALSLNPKVIDITGVYQLNKMATISSVSDVLFVGTALIEQTVSIGTALRLENSNNLSFDNIAFDCKNLSIVNAINIEECSNISFNEIKIENVFSRHVDIDTSGLRCHSNSVSIGKVILHNIISEADIATITASGALNGVLVQIDETHRNFSCELIEARNFYNVNSEGTRIIRDADVFKCVYVDDVYSTRVNSGIYIGCISAVNCDKRWAKVMSGGVVINALTGNNIESTEKAASLISIFSDNVVVCNANVTLRASVGIEITAGAKNVIVDNCIIKGSASYSWIYLRNLEETDYLDVKISNSYFYDTMSEISSFGIYIAGNGNMSICDCQFELNEVSCVIGDYNTEIDRFVLENCRFTVNKVNTNVVRFGRYEKENCHLFFRNVEFECVVNNTTEIPMDFRNMNNSYLEIDGLSFILSGNTYQWSVLLCTVPVTKISRYSLENRTTTSQRNLSINANSVRVNRISDDLTNSITVSDKIVVSDFETTQLGITGSAEGAKAYIFACDNYSLSSIDS